MYARHKYNSSQKTTLTKSYMRFRSLYEFNYKNDGFDTIFCVIIHRFLFMYYTKFYFNMIEFGAELKLYISEPRDFITSAF